MPYRKQISRRLALYLLLFSSLITLILTGIQLLLDYRYGIDIIHQRLQQIANTNIASFEQASWTFNEKSIDLQLEGLSKINDVVRVELKGPHGEVLKSYTGISGEPIATRSYPLNYLYRGQQNYLGELVVQVTDARLIQHLIDKLLIILGTQAIKTFFVTLFILVIFQYLVTEHLQRIAEYALRVNPLQRFEPLDLNRRVKNHTKDDELDLLVESINSMQYKLIDFHNNLLQSRTDAARSEARFETIFESIDDAVLFADKDHKIVHVNRSFCRQFQYSRQELVGQEPQLIHADPDDSIEAAAERSHDGSRAPGDPMEIRYRRRDDTEFTGETVGAPVITAEGTHIGYLLIIRDITEKIEVRELNRQLQRQLLHAQKMESIGQLTGGIAHDFNNILGIVIGNLDLLQREVAGQGEAARLIDSTQKSAQRATDLTRQLLSFSLQQPARQVVTDINKVIVGMESLIARSVTPEVEVEHKLAANLWMTEIDPGDFEDALLNMVINARDAMPGGGKLILETRNCALDELHCRYNPGCHPGDYVQLAVSDSGEGMTLEQQESIFEPFYTTKPRGKGTGLGLAMVYGFIKRSGGFIKVHSGQNLGSTFRLYLPRAANAHSVQPHRSAAGQPQMPAAFRTGTILVVDDEKELLALTRTFLEQLGHRVMTAGDAREALACLAANPTIDLLISDVVMPGGMNGYELAEQATRDRPELKVLLASGYIDKSVVKPGQAPYSATLLSKPYTLAELEQRVRAKLGEQTESGMPSIPA